jgi:hypothetical protein
MVGSAVAMMVWFNAARNAASINPKKMVRISAWPTAPAGGEVTSCERSPVLAAPALPARRDRRLQAACAPSRAPWRGPWHAPARLLGRNSSLRKILNARVKSCRTAKSLICD